MAKIISVDRKSPFYGKIKADDELISVNGRKIRDVLDYMFETADISGDVTVIVCRNGEQHCFSGKCDGDLGFSFSNFLMDKQRSCKNKCVFCFIDQMPPAMRDTLYFKDDDFRLSLVYGNYVTLTNVDDEEIDRICELHVSPLNISVHSTDPETRYKMLRNPRAKDIMKNLRKLKDAGINLRCQIVLCPGINDGDGLTKSLEDLAFLYPAVSSVSIVPVGLTKFRDGLAPLVPFTKETAADALRRINEIGDECLKKYGTRIFYGADEFYLKSEIPVPDVSFYEDMEQYENGVGMLSCFKDDFAYYSEEKKPNDSKVKISLVTGVAAAETIDGALKTLSDKYPGLDYTLYTIYNDYFGRTITVAGLVTATDIIAQLKGKNLGAYLIIPDVMLRDDTFLDDLTVSDVERELAVPVRVASDGAEGLLDAVEFCVKHSKKRG